MASTLVLATTARGEVPLEKLTTAQTQSERATPPAAPGAATPRVPDRPPVLSGPSTVRVVAGQPTVVGFDVSDPETPPGEILLEVSVPDRTLLPEGSLRLEGDGPRRALTIIPPPGAVGSTTLDLTAIDAAGHSARSSVVVTIGEVQRTGSLPIPSASPTSYFTSTASPVVYETAAALGGCGSSRRVSYRPALTSTPVVPRGELVKGRAASDGPTLFNAAFEAYWDGNYAQAVEDAAAAAYLWDDPRVWDYLALASLKVGDPSMAWAAARYSAAREVTEPTFERPVSLALVRVQGPLRNQLEWMKSGVSDRRVALAVLAAKPDLSIRPTSPGPESATSLEPAATGRSVVSREQ